MRPHTDYGDMIYDQPSNESFYGKVESIQNKVAFAMTGSIQDTSKEKLFIELSLESLKSRKWFRRVRCIFKIMKNQVLEYLNNLIPKRKQNFNSRNIYIPN